MNENQLNEDLPGFDQPIALLRACHSRILDHCDLLEQLSDRLQGAAQDDEGRTAAQRVIGYFSTSGRQHHQDEEVDLFPLLVRQSLKLADLIHTLKREHTTLENLWLDLEPELKRFPGVAEPETFVSNVAAFCELNRKHVQTENMEFLPVAESSLSSDRLRDIGMAMAERRGVRFPE